MIDIDELDRLHGEAVANKGGDFEVDTDEAFRIYCMENVPAISRELRALRRALEVALDCLANMHDDEECKFTDPEAEGCHACHAFEQIAEAEDNS